MKDKTAQIGQVIVNTDYSSKEDLYNDVFGILDYIILNFYISKFVKEQDPFVGALYEIIEKWMDNDILEPINDVLEQADYADLMFIHTLNFMKIHVKITNVIQKYAANSKYAKENKLHDVYTPIFEMIQEKIKPYYEQMMQKGGYENMCCQYDFTLTESQIYKLRQIRFNSANQKPTEAIIYNVMRQFCYNHKEFLSKKAYDILKNYQEIKEENGNSFINIVINQTSQGNDGEAFLKYCKEKFNNISCGKLNDVFKQIGNLVIITDNDNERASESYYRQLVANIASKKFQQALKKCADDWKHH